MRNCSIAVFVLLLASVAVAAQEKVRLAINLPAGTSWTFAQTEKMDMNSTMSFAGQQQQMKQSANRKISGKAEVLEADGGTPSAIRITFDRDSGGTMDQGMGGPQPMPFPLAGETVTVRINNGQVTHDYKGQLDPQTTMELQSLADQEKGMLPKEPVGVGDTWSPDLEQIAKTWQIDLNKNKVSVGFEVKEFIDLRGRRAMIALLTADIMGEMMPGLNGSRKMQGPVLIDVESGRVLSADLNGTMEMNGSQDTGQGQMTMQSSGTISTKIESALAGTVPPSDRPATGGNPLAAGGNPLAAGGAPASLGGTYQDEQLKLDLVEQGGGNYAGTITMADQKFPVTATMTDGQLVGSFESGGNRFDFTATPQGDALRFKTGDTEYTLKKSTAKKNPLSR